jgi:hypothetical protein
MATQSGRSRALRNVTLAWAAITGVTALMLWPLLLTLPILACLLVAYWVEPRGFDILYAVITAVTMTVCIAWFLGRVDERPMEGVAAAFFIACGFAELLVLRAARSERVKRR